MSEENLEQAFWDLAEQMLALANEKAQEIDPGVVSESMMYAAARFSTFVMAVNSQGKEDFVTDRSEYFKYLAGRYRNFLDENFDDYSENFDKHLPDHDGDTPID